MEDCRSSDCDDAGGFGSIDDGACGNSKRPCKRKYSKRRHTILR
ncbi:MAG: hypothetical protein N2V73_00555 [Candidatus Methanospirare jalkutatii]|nr:hypothetical protein [Candidatus Methanospirare jalkutatii]